MKLFTSFFRTAINSHPSRACQESGRSEQTGSAGPRNVQFPHLSRTVCCIHQRLNVRACTIAADHTDELFDVVALQLDLRCTILGECWLTVLVGRMSQVIQLVLDQCAELKVAALGAVVGSQRDDESRHVAKPITHLLLHPGFLPTTSAERYLLGLAQDCPALLLEARRRPHDPDVCIQ